MLTIVRRLSAHQYVRVRRLEVYPFRHTPAEVRTVQGGGWVGRSLSHLAIDFCDLPEIDGSMPASRFFKEFYSQVRAFLHRFPHHPPT